MSPADPVVIVAAKRTPIGSFQGKLSSLSAPELSAVCIADVVTAAGVWPAEITEAIMGCVLPAGVGQAPARQAILRAGFPSSTPCTTINKVCGSGMKAVMLGHDQILAGSAKVVLAGGMESMSNAPYLLPKARGGYRLGHGQMLDHMFYDGLQNPYDGQLMGYFAELCVDRYSFSRAAQDAYAVESVRRAQAAVKEGRFKAEISPVEIRTRDGKESVVDDETPHRCDPGRISTLKPVFRNEGSVTAANSSSISDGAAALVLMSRSEAVRRGVQPLAYIRGHVTIAQEPEWFTTAPVGAIKKLLRQLDWNADDIDLYEINEAFAVVAMVAMQDLKLRHDRVNVNGGACALGHPIGATGARILVTLAHALRSRGLRRGIASLCIGGGEATAVALEAV